ncbi:MAG: PDDEXK nuclease domain-containing protein [Capsulimonadaceae bacterium]
MPARLSSLLEQVRDLVNAARRRASQSINVLQTNLNFEIGRLIVEHEQRGDHRAQYGKRVMEQLAIRMTYEIGRGFSVQNLKNMRSFYLLFKDRLPEIRQKASGELPAPLLDPNSIVISDPGDRSHFNPFPLSWSHYVLLIGIRDANERRFYEIEAERNSWSIPQLKRQVASGLYERLALSRHKDSVRQLAKVGQTIAKPSDLIKDPYVLEFLGLDETPSYSESELESAIISKLERFLLELGKGFLFEARQKRFTFDEDHFYVDLVFYNRLLRCYVLIDLKLDQLTHQDLGQMQMYVNYFDRFAKTPEENPTIGILLCKSKKDAIVELTLPKDANIFASAYQLYLPSKEDLRKQLLEWTEADVEVGEDT